MKCCDRCENHLLSALTGEGVTELFDSAVRMLPERILYDNDNDQVVQTNKEPAKAHTDAKEPTSCIIC